jgi:hypothetical protein
MMYGRCLLSQNHRSQIPMILYRTCPLTAKSNLRGAKITDSMPRNYGSLKTAIKRVQSHARMNSAEREQTRC